MAATPLCGQSFFMPDVRIRPSDAPNKANSLQRKNKTTFMQTEKEQRFKDFVHATRACSGTCAGTAGSARHGPFQEVLCSHWRDIEKHKGASSERIWDYRVAVNTTNSIKQKKYNQIQMSVIPKMGSSEGNQNCRKNTQKRTIVSEKKDANLIHS